MPYVTEDTLTDVVLQRWQQIPDPRLRQVMTSLIKHLHAFVREVEPTGRNGSRPSTGSPAPARCAPTSGRSSSWPPTCSG